MKTTGCIHDGWLVLHQPKVDPDYLYHALSSDLVFDQFDRLAAGSTVRNLNIGLAKSVEIPYPPLAEQQRIVGLLDEAFEGIATAKVNAEKNLQNARALFESQHSSIFRLRREGWAEKPLGEVCEYVNGKAHEQYIDEGGRFIVINSKFISTEGEVLKRSNDALLLLQPGDIAMVLSDVPNGKALAKCFLVEEANTYTLNRGVAEFRNIPRCGKLLSILAEKDKVCRRAALGAWFRSSGLERREGIFWTFCGPRTFPNSSPRANAGRRWSIRSG